MDKRKPSDVFLELWRVRELQMPDAFKECAETWLAIVAMEAEADAERQKRTLLELVNTHAVYPIKVHAETAEKVHADAAKKYAEDDGAAAERDTSSAGQSPAPSPPGEGSEEVQNGPPARDNAEIGKKAIAARKQNDMARLEALRDRGVSMQDVADAAPDLQLYDVLRFLERKPIPLPKLAALEKALKKLEG